MSIGFPGMGGMPGAVPGAVPGVPQQAAAAAFVLDIAPDPTWEPFDTTDVLEKDGYYAFRIKSESASREGQKPGVFFTLEILDDDARGKIISKKMGDPRLSSKDSSWVWRSLVRSITGTLNEARAGFRYTVGSLTNQTVYGKTGAYTDDKNNTRTGVDTFITKAEYDNAVASKGHRWAPHAAGGGATPMGALPGGLPASFPGMGSVGLPGAPGAPTGAPQPVAAAPMQQAPSAITLATTPGAAPQPASAFAPAPVQVAQAPAPFAFPAGPGGAPPPGFPPAVSATPTNGAPQPAAFPIFPGLPGGPTT